MKLNFGSENNYIQFNKSPGGKIHIILSAQDPKNINSNIVNSVEITEEELLKLTESVRTN